MLLGAQLNNYRIVSSTLNVKHSYKAVKYPQLSGESATYCMQNIQR